jgi:hypothetical protein
MRKKRNQNLRFAVCINNDGYKASLEVGKIYSVVEDPDEHGMIRVVDNSGENYLFEAARFFPIEIPAKLARALSAL